MFTACNIDNIDRILDTAENIVDNKPDSALMRLGSIKPSTVKTPEQQVRHILLTLYAKDLSDEDISNDSTVIHVIDYLKKVDNLKYLAFAEYYLGRIYQAQGKDEQAMELYLIAKTKADKMNEENIKGLICSHIGQQYYNQRKHDDAIGYFESALGYFSKSKSNHKRIMATFNNIANCFLLKQDSAMMMTYYNKALESAITAQDSADIMQNLGFAYLSLNDHNNAKQQLFHALKLNSDSTLQSLIYLNISKVYEKENLTDSAIYFAELSLKSAKNNNYVLMNIYNILSNMERKKKNHKKADKYYTLYNNYFKQINKEKNKKPNIQFIEAKYNLNLLQSENNTLKTIIKRILIGVFLLVIIIGISSKYLYLAKKKILELKKKVAVSEGKVVVLGKNIVELGKKTAELSKEHFEMIQKNIKKIAVFHCLLCVINNKIDSKNFISSIKTMSIFNNENHDFYEDINILYEGLFDKIKNKYPEMADDMDNIAHKIICLTCIDFDNYDIALLLNVDKHVIERKKSEIRKILKLKKGGDIKAFVLDSLK
jgi:tetratricopeptide (TPR) repeat protein